MNAGSSFGEPPKVRVELAGPEDAGLLFELTLVAFAEYRDALDPPTGVLSETIDDAIASIAAAGAAIAWIDSQPVGAVRWEPRGDYLYAGRLSVVPAARGAGAGASLMVFVENQARLLGLPSVQVGVRSALPGNLEFFHKLGFFQIAVEPHPRKPSATSVTLQKTLKP